VPRRAIFSIVAFAAVAVLIAMTGARVLAPGPPGFYIEPMTRMVLMVIEPGSFVMGSPTSEPGRNEDEVQHRVTLTRRIYIGRYEVTQTEWQVVMGANPSRFSGCASCPVEQVNFFEVDDFLTRLTARSTAIRYRLPTEAEWEYACRAGTTTTYSVGDHLTIHDANISAPPEAQQTPGVGAYRTRPVGSFPPNAWGLRDMHGNVWEWTNDFYGPYDLQATVNPRGATVGPLRVIRGGSWYFGADSARCGLRYTHAPQDRGFSLGFRVVAEPLEPVH